MKQQSHWWVVWFFKRPHVSLLEKQRNWQHDIRCLITNTWENRVAIVSSIITRYSTLASTGVSHNLTCRFVMFSALINNICCHFFAVVYKFICLSFIWFCSVLFTFVRLFSVWWLNPFSHGVGHIGHALLWRQIAIQIFNYENFEKLSIPRKLSCEYFLSEGFPLKNIILCLFS